MLYLFNKLFFKVYKVQFLLAILIIVIASIIEGLLLGTLNVILVNITSNDQPINNLQETIIKLWSFFGINQEKIIYGFIFLIILSFLFRCSSLVYNNYIVLSVGRKLSSDIFSLNLKRENQNKSTFSSYEINSVAQKIQLLTTSVFVPLINSVTAIIISFAIICYLLNQGLFIYLLLIVCLLSIYFLIVFMLKGKLLKNSFGLNEYQDKRNKIINETILGYRELTISNLLYRSKNDYLKNESNFLSIALENLTIGSLPKFLIESILLISFAIFAIFAVNYQLDFSTIGASLGTSLLAMLRLIPHIQSIYNSWARIIGNLEVIRSISETTLSLEKSQNKNDDTFEDIFQKSNNNIQGTKIIKISFDKVYFKIQNKVLIEKFNHEFIKEQKFKSLPKIIGITGESGSGKSTILDLFSGFNTPLYGFVEYQYLLESKLYKTKTKEINFFNSKLISHVSQKPFIFDESLLYNITLTNDLKSINLKLLKKIWDICDLKKVSKLNEQNLIKLVGEQGKAISGGQQQRVGLARALYLERPILLLDEPFNALDSISEKKILSSLKNHNCDFIFIISHNDNSFFICNELIKIKNNFPQKLNIEFRSLN